MKRHSISNFRLVCKDQVKDTGVALQNHKMEGVIQIYSAANVTVEGKEVGVIVMDVLEESWTSYLQKSKGDVPFERFLNQIIRLVGALEALRENGYIHDNLGTPNIMLCKEGKAHLIDIDSLPLSTGECADYKIYSANRVLHGFLGDFVRRHFPRDHPIRDALQNCEMDSFKLYKESLIQILKTYGTPI